MTVTVLLLPIIGAFIGYITNYLAVKMLFHPKKPVKIVFFSIQGLFPKRQRAFADKLGIIVAAELLSVRDITEKLIAKTESEDFTALIEERIKVVILEKLPRDFPMIAMVLSEEVVGKITQIFMQDIKVLMHDLVTHLSEKLERDIDVRELVADKVAKFSTDKLEEILFTVMRQEFRFIEILGGVLGFLIGLVQALLVISVAA